MAYCDSPLDNLGASCAAIEKIAGVAARIYVGKVRDIDPEELTFGVDGSITAFELLTGKNLYTAESKIWKNAGRSSLVVNENGPNTFTHAFDFVAYAFDQADILAIQQLALADQLFIIAELNSGQLKAYGIAHKAGLTLNFQNFGLKASSNEETTGVVMSDDNTNKLTLEGSIPNLPQLFKPLTALATNLTDLDAMVAA